MTPHDPSVKTRFRQHLRSASERLLRPLKRVRGGIVWGAALLTLSVLAQAPESARDHVVIVLDASGSMAGRIQPETPVDRMTAAKVALLKVTQKLSTNTHSGLLVFSDPRLKDDWVYPLGPLNLARLREAIRQPQPGAGTPLGAYLKKGADRLLQAREEHHGYGTYRLLVVTDGEAQDADLVERYTPEITRRGLTLDVIGVAMAQRHTLARLASSYRPANDSAALDRAVSEVLAEGGNAPGSPAIPAADFELLRALPVGLATAAVEALSQVENTPIGDRRTGSIPPDGARPRRQP